MQNALKLLAVITITLNLSLSCQAATHRPSENMREAINNLPAASETLMVWQDFNLPERNGEPGRKRVGQEGVPGFLFERVQGWALLPMAEVDDGSLYDLLAGCKITFALEGAGNFRPVEGNTSYLFDGCHLIQFQNSLPDAFAQKLAQVRSDHFAYGNSEISACKTKWGDVDHVVYIALPQTNLLLMAMDKPSIQEALDKISAKSTLGAQKSDHNHSGDKQSQIFPNSLPEWRYTDTSQHIWGLRHFKDQTNDNMSPLVKGSRMEDDKAVGATVDCVKTPDSPCGTMNVHYLTRSQTLPWPRLKGHDPNEGFEHKGLCWTWKHQEHSEIGEAVEWYLGLGLMGHTINF